MGAVNDAVEDGIAEGWVADDFVPAADGNLAGDQQGALAVAIIDDLEQVAALFGGQGLRPPIIDDQQAGAFEGGHQPREPAFAAGRGDISKQARGAPI